MNENIVLDKEVEPAWTTSIRLAKVTAKAYQEIEREWGFRPSQEKDHIIYAELMNPIVAQGYESLIGKFLEHPFPQQLCVRENVLGWHKYHIEQLLINGKRSPALTKFLAELAANDRDERNHFEMEFKARSDYAQGIERKAQLSFAKHQGVIISYEIDVHPHNIDDLFSYSFSISDPQKHRIRAIWRPGER